jgi:hypothetical protein
MRRGTSNRQTVSVSIQNTEKNLKPSQKWESYEEPMN